MGVFTDLIRNLEVVLAPGEVPAVSPDEMLFRLAESLGWRAMRPNQMIELPETTHTIAISAIYWSRPDLAILDDLLSRPNPRGIVIWVFDPSSWLPDQQLLPGLPKMRATPMFAEYAGTTVVSFTQGRANVSALINAIFPGSSNASV